MFCHRQSCLLSLDIDHWLAILVSCSGLFQEKFLLPPFLFAMSVIDCLIFLVYGGFLHTGNGIFSVFEEFSQRFATPT